MAQNDDIWSQLLFFESSQYAASRFKEFHGGEANAAKLAEIGSSIRQARLFHESFIAADFVVKPLILYYSNLALSRALILFLDAKKREANLAKQHGLGIVGWSEFLNQQSSQFSDLKVKIENGTFLELLEATKNINLVRANSSAVNYHLAYPAPPAGMEVTLDELCRRIPDLGDEYEKWSGSKITAAKLLSVTSKGSDVEVKIENQKRFSGSDALEEQFLKSIFPKAKSFDLTKQTIIVGADGLPIISDIIETAPFQIGDGIVLPRINDEVLSNIGLLFALSYALGMLARYYPSHWISLQSLGPKGHFFPYCMRLLDYIGYSFPRMSVDVFANLNRLK